MQRWSVALIVMGWWLYGAAASRSFAAGDVQRDTLRGLPGVWVVVEKLSPELERAGLTQGHLQQEAEDKLRQAGIPVLTQEECWQTPGMPWLYLTIALLKVSDTRYAATIGAVLYQEVMLTRAPQLKTFGVTWDTGIHLGAVGAGSLPTVRASVGTLVDKFTADYQAVNGRGEK